MVPFEEAASMLDELADGLPREIFEKLNGGVNLLRRVRQTRTGSSSWVCISWIRWAGILRSIMARSVRRIPTARPSASGQSCPNAQT
jgi:hypothetical protein